MKTRLDEAYDVVYARLKDEQLTFWSSGSSATIPDNVTPHVAALMAKDATSTYRVSDAVMGRITLEVEGTPNTLGAWEGIRAASTPKYESLDEPEYF